MGAVLSCAVVVGVSAPPAAALNGPETRALSGLKRQFLAMTPAVRASTCEPYATAGAAWIRGMADAAMANPASAAALSRASWRRVLTAYYGWACPGGEPRSR